MAEDLPSPSPTSPLCLTQRTSITNDDDHHEVQQPSLTLSPPLLTTLEDQSVNCSPNKPKIENPSTIEGLRGSCEGGSPTDEVGTDILGGKCHFVDVSDKGSKFEVGTKSLDGGSEFGVFESEKKNSVLERDGVCIVEGENVLKFLEVGISFKNCSEKQTVEFGLGKKIENSERNDPKTGECLELKDESGFCKDFSEEENENSERSDPKTGECLEIKAESSSCKDFSEKGNENSEGSDPKTGDYLEFKAESGFCKGFSGKVNENSERSDPKTGEYHEIKAESGFCKDFSEKENENSKGSNKTIGSCKEYSEKKNGNLEGLLPKLVKNNGDSLKGNSLTCSLKIEVVDGTALVDVVKIDGKKNKRMGRNSHTISNGGGASRASNGGKRKLVYSRKEMESLRFVNVKGQKKFWQEISYGFAQTVRKEYDELGTFRHHKNKAASMTNYHGQGILGESTSENVSCDAETVSSPDLTGGGGKDGDDLWSGQEESDDEYESIQRPAFWVEGEPDFESGPPEDGLEYLRRVRWEAAHIPKVKVAKIDNSKLNKEQSVYMPNIPDIDKCPPHLLPLQQWEDDFVADFSDLRLALSRCLEDTGDTEPQSIIFLHKEHTSRLSESMKSLELPSGGPTLSAVVGMDPVTRVTMLKRRISLFDSASEFSKDDCAWLFALCAVVDSPLDADTSASMRCLLRRCAKLRAAKSELDDEVVMLNVLATISGKFFGQSET